MNIELDGIVHRMFAVDASRLNVSAAASRTADVGENVLQ